MPFVKVVLDSVLDKIQFKKTKFMAYGICCKNCGWYEADHSGGTGFKYFTEEVVAVYPGRMCSFENCTGYVPESFALEEEGIESELRQYGILHMLPWHVLDRHPGVFASVT